MNNFVDCLEFFFHLNYHENEDLFLKNRSVVVIDLSTYTLCDRHRASHQC